MLTAFVSTASMSEATRLALAKAQAQMADAQKELATGRHADVGRTLGARTAMTLSSRQEYARLESISDTNTVLSSRLDYTQSMLEGISKAANTFLTSVVAGSATPQGAAGALQAGKDALRAFVDLMNSSYDGEHLFAGINIDTKPIADYFDDPPPLNKQAVDTAFLAQFGVAQSDPGASGITAADMQTFLDGPYATMFDAASWPGTWSSASSENQWSRISPNEFVETSMNVNEEAVRKMAQAFTMVADLGVENLNDAARKVVFETATRLVSEASAGMNALRGQIGLAQERITVASDRMSIQMNIFANNIGLMENVDPAEVSVRISALTTQIETSYAVTARLHQLSLVNYL